MPYKKPICDCGNELLIYEESIILMETKMTKQGTLSKKSHKVKGANHSTGCSWLKCDKCDNEYDWHFEHGKVMRDGLR